MEVCQHCEMYMKPFVSDGKATCEFCGKVIARVVNKRWVKQPPQRGSNRSKKNA